MGMITHDAVVFTFGELEPAQRLRDAAIDLGLQCTSVVTSRSNGYSSFLVIPDGSKDSWETSDQCDIARRKLLLLAGMHDNCDWVHVRYSDDHEHVSLQDSSISQRYGLNKHIGARE